MLALGVAFAGACGAVARYLVDGWVQNAWRGPFPAGTFVVNMSGSAVLGIITGWVLARGGAPVEAKALLGTGFVGAYTTFSTLTYESLRLTRDGARGYALLNLTLSMTLGLAAAGGGIWIGRKI